MKVVIVNTYDIQGGAARAAYRLHKALLARNIDSTMLVEFKVSDDLSVATPTSNLKKIIGRIRYQIDRFFVNKYKNKNSTLFSTSKIPFTNIAERINSMKPDVVHLHWVAGGFLDINDLEKIKAPIIWTFHDDWAITGGCHIKWDCEKYKIRCGNCPVLGSDKKYDLSTFNFDRKQKVISNKPNLKVVAVSRWLKDCISESAIFAKNEILYLPNLINLLEFSPIEKNLARQILNLPKDKKLILFGAMNATSDVNKGFLFLAEALALLPGDDIELVVFGSSEPAVKQGFKHTTHYLGQLNDNVSLKLLYSAADVMLVPSKQESFGQTAIESMACGTPVVAFATSGLLDIIDHKVNGYLAEKFNISDFSKGIEWILYTADKDILMKNAREKVKNNFSDSIVCEKYIQLYNSTI